MHLHWYISACECRFSLGQLNPAPHADTSSHSLNALPPTMFTKTFTNLATIVAAIVYTVAAKSGEAALLIDVALTIVLIFWSKTRVFQFLENT